MATIVQENDNESATSAQASLAVSLTNVQQGNLIAVFVKQEAVSTTITVSDGTDSLTAATKKANVGGNSWGQWFYLLNANPGSRTYTASFSPSTDFPSIFAYEIQATVLFPYRCGWKFDTEALNNGNGTALSSGNMVVTGTRGIAFGGYVEFFSTTLSSVQINGVAADRVDTLPSNSTVAWAKTHTAGFTGAATATISSSVDWAACAIAFAEVPRITEDYTSFPKFLLQPFPTGAGGSGRA